jgi:hypothetical protein
MVYEKIDGNVSLNLVEPGQLFLNMKNFVLFIGIIPMF